MRFVPPVAGLSSGTIAFDGDPHMRNRPVGEVLPRCARSGSTSPRATGCRSPCRARARARRDEVVVDASASSQFISALLLAGARYDDGVDVRHEGKPVPSLPHIEMTVAMLREHGVEVDDSRPRTAGRSLPGPVRAVDRAIEPDLSNAAPFLALAAVSGGTVTVRDWPRAPPRPATRCATSSRRWGARSPLVDDGPHRHGQRSAPGVDLDLHDVGELTPAVAALCALADGPVAAARHRAHPRPRDRPAGRAGHRARPRSAPT
jgi:3-phosphoshikimate 1-carboxyvinyltransferase